MDSNSHPGWHILITEPRRELHAAAQLTARGIKAYCPEMPPQRKIRRKKVVSIVVPMFPGYLFTPAVAPNWLTIERTSGVVASRPVLIVNDKPARIAHYVMQLIEKSERDLRHKARFGEWPSRFKPGEKVRVSDAVNPFFGLFGSVDRMEGRDRVRVLLSLLGTATPVVLHEQCLEVA